VPLSPTFFATVAGYMDDERPPDATSDSVFVSLKGSHRGQPLSTSGLDEIVRAARKRAGLTHGTCHELRHTCFTRLREAGMAIEAIQAQAGHRSISSTRIYLHLGVDWLADEYRRAVEAIEAHLVGGPNDRPGPINAAKDASAGRRDTRGDVGRDRRPSAPDGGHHGLLPGPTRSLVPSEHGVCSGPGSPSLRPTGHHSRSHLCRLGRIGRPHIEDFKCWQAARPGKGGKPLSTTTIRHRLGFCAPSSNASSSGTTTTLRLGSPSTRATFPPSTNHCPGSWTIRRRPSSWPHWPPTRTADVG
jgi:Phage integrase family